MTATIGELVDDFFESERPVGNLLLRPEIVAQAVAAVRMYAAFGGLFAVQNEDGEEIDPAGFTDITEETPITVSEWGYIRPLFLLYVEREQAIQLEASRGMGVDVFGRSVSEISSEIQQRESELPHAAFCVECETV